VRLEAADVLAAELEVALEMREHDLVVLTLARVQPGAVAE